MSVPPDFGGFTGCWLDGYAYLARYGRGRPIESVRMTPLNLLQAHKLLGELIAIGEADGQLSAEHRRQSELLPTSHGLDDIIPRARVDDVAGGN